MYTFKFETDINCNNCIRAVSPYLNSLDDVESWTVDLDDPKKILTVESENESEKYVMDAVLDAGFNIKKI